VFNIPDNMGIPERFDGYYGMAEVFTQEITKLGTPHETEFHVR
jgi:hypothetical protein